MVVSMHMSWRHVLFANWPVDPSVVRPHLPEALDLDTFDGRAWLSVVPFTNVDVRPTWAPKDLGFRLPELNLRTYVTHDGDPGVYFFSLDAEGVFGVLGARLLHSLPYYYARIDLQTDGERVRFESDRLHPGARPVRFRGRTSRPATACPSNPARWPTSSSSGPLLHGVPAGEIKYATVDHEPWPLYEADVSIEANTLFRANWFAHPETDPVHFYSPGVETVASPSRA